MRDRIVNAKRAGREEQASKAASESASAAAATAAAAAAAAAATGQPLTGVGAAATPKSRGRPTHPSQNL